MRSWPQGTRGRWRIPALLVCLLSLAAAQPDPVADAAAALERGDFASAEQKLKAVLAAHPNHAVALGLLGVALDGRRKFAEADQAYRRALAIEPGSPRLLNNFGNHLLASGNKAGAREVFTKLVALDPAHANANLQLARLELERKSGAEALRFLDRLPAAMRAAPQVGLLRMRALYECGRRTEADELLERLTSTAPEDVRLNFSAGMELAAAGQYEKAETFFSRALKVEPASFDVLYN
ncbi:MAG TPA: tetratricopeptide repeat protein, partial [Bryobacteraceae bacterium]|nr:tetratricopeptide repeat protein [Bryobacteraceae bacterium]